jgi:hypothetical protein
MDVDPPVLPPDAPNPPHPPVAATAVPSPAPAPLPALAAPRDGAVVPFAGAMPAVSCKVTAGVPVQFVPLPCRAPPPPPPVARLDFVVVLASVFLVGSSSLHSQSVAQRIAVDVARAEAQAAVQPVARELRPARRAAR